MGSAATQRSLLGLLCCVSCSAPGSAVLGYPSWPAQSWVFALEQPQAPVEARVQLRADERADVAIRLEAEGGRALLHAFAYEVPLAELGLSSGVIPPAKACERSCALTRPARHFELDYDFEHPSSWTEATSVGAAALDVLVPDRHDRCREGCLSFTSTRTQIDGDASTAFLLPEQPRATEAGAYESALLGLTDGTLYRVRGPGSIERLCRGGGYAPTAGALDASRSRIWAATSELEVGSLELGALDPDRACPFVRTATGAPGPRIFRILASSTDGSLLVLSSTGALARVRGPQVTGLGLVSLRTTEASSLDGFLIEHDGLTYAAIGGDEVVTLRGDELSRQRAFSLGAKVTQAMSALSHGGTLYAGFLSYNLYVLNRGRFDPLDEGLARMGATWDDPSSLSFNEGSILSTLNHGFVGEWSPATSYCPIQGPFNIDGAHFSLNLGGRLFSGDGDAVSASKPRALLWLIPSKSETCAVRP